MYFLFLIFILVGIAIGITIDRLLVHFKRNELIPATLPLMTPLIEENEYKKIQLYLKEWEIIINTQMHFNDLILRFRAITLTAFVTLIGATFATEKILKLPQEQVFFIFILILMLWGTAFLIDFFYYHRMLLGSVAEALKFDSSEIHNTYGLFGMTIRISKHVHPPTSNILVCLYYFVPFAGFIILWLWKTLL